jgi:AraC family L-rhamnose operon transcriptional activator RhaR/AraC family L-rhamnose operon regulatory protein RhaS
MASARATEVEHLLPDDLPIRVMRWHAQDSLELHRHPFFELVTVNAGRGIHVTNAGEFPIVAGDVFVISGPVSHGYKMTDRLVITNILFLPKRLRMPMQDIRELPGYHVLFTLEPHYRAKGHFESRLHLEPRERSLVASWVEALDQELVAQKPAYRFLATAHFMQIVGFLSRCYSSRRVPAAAPLLRIGQALSYLEQHFAEPIRLEELERIAHMSRTALLRAFRQALDVSPIDYLIRLRISRASELLRNSELSVSEIGYRVGFSDSNYFARQFRSVMGTSPRAYRGAKA